MSKKDYILIAKALIDTYNASDTSKEGMFYLLLSRLSFDFRRDNKNFDNTKFYTYIKKGLYNAN